MTAMKNKTIEELVKIEPRLGRLRDEALKIMANSPGNYEDRNPSMSIKDNRTHCFSCNKTWDSIALVMELKGYKFVEAVKFLNEVYL